MKKLLFLILLLCFYISVLNAQQATDTVMFKYSRDFPFNDGIYLSFSEFKNNRPSFSNFNIINDDQYGRAGSTMLAYPCHDSAGMPKLCAVKECFGYCSQGVVYLWQGYGDYYYRLFIIGALSHYLAFQQYNSYPVLVSDQPVGFTGTTAEYTEYLLDFETGESFPFTYKSFSNFLKTHDEELYNALEKSRGKRKLIHNFLLKYNEKHPVYFPVILSD